MYNQLEYH